MKFSVGKLRHKIDIIKKSVVRKSGGGFTETWSVESSIWAQIKPKTGGYLLTHNDKKSNVTHDIIIRSNSIVTTKKLIRFGSRFFSVDGVYDIDERGRYMKIDSIENTNINVTVV